MTGRGRRLSLEAPAKINLYLKVLGRRADGYHELDSVMARLTLSDRLTLEIDGSGQLEDRLISTTTLSGGLPPDFDGPGNLLLTGIRAFRRALGGWPQAGVTVSMEKNIPLGSGLGGGSTDCAAVLAALNSQAPAPLSAEDLRQLASGLGADIPFFLQPRPLARARGIGEKLTEPPPEYAGWAGRGLILVNPGIEVSTGKVFTTLGLTNPPPDNNLGPVSWPGPGENDLFRPALQAAHEMTEAAESIEKLQPVHWGLSGSGATFWLHSDSPDRDLEKLKTAHPEWWIKKTSIAAL
ncbi:4-(cytidine 5'-diphospho)-2-C-methyl-D-erythritol kinase [Deltaproteobacteria bacterium Smac51]|nr:4-(cytidine 5'-diphospho)-2-C-methyl-D-erythritol kinase [Deltaproteobacteria bacterium Smac51]